MSAITPDPAAEAPRLQLLPAVDVADGQAVRLVLIAMIVLVLPALVVVVLGRRN